MSTIKLYNVEFKKENNFIIEELESYLTADKLKYTFNNFQYIKNNLNVSIKLNLSQHFLNVESPAINYLSVNNGDGATYYYFIDSKSWIAQQTILINCSLDILNTLRLGVDYSFNNKTHIIREHKNRFSELDVTEQSSSIVRAFPVIDYTAEDVNAPLVSKNLPINIPLTKNNFNQPLRKWYLIYKSSTLEPTAPVNCFLCSDTALHTGHTSSGSFKVFSPNAFEVGKYYYFVYDDNGAGANFSITDVTDTPYNYTLTQTTRRVFAFYVEIIDNVKFLRFKQYNYDSVGSHTSTTTPSIYRTQQLTCYKMAVARVLNYDTNNLNDILNNGSIYSINAGIVSGFDVMPISSVDRTNTQLIKIIELPYAPASVYELYNNSINFDSNIWEYAYTESMLKLKDLNADLTNTFKTGIGSSELSDVFYYNKTAITRTDQANRYLKDSKLKHSQFYQAKFIYDSFAYPFKFECIPYQTFKDWYTNKYLNIEFTPTNTINSRFMFTFSDLATNRNEGEDYSNILIVNRNNEIPLYTSAYLEYIKNGYNYDVKAKERDDTTKAINIALSAIGSLASFISSPVTGGVGIAGGIGLATSTASQVVGAVASANASAQNIEKTLNNLAKQSASVSNSDTIDLLSKYNGNKLQFKLYQLDERMNKLIDDLFYYTGYKCDEFGAPNVSSRIYFNYLQCEPVFNSLTDVYNDYLDILKGKFIEGVTFIHKYKNRWDISQNLENLETFLIQYF